MIESLKDGCLSAPFKQCERKTETKRGEREREREKHCDSAVYRAVCNTLCDKHEWVGKISLAAGINHVMLHQAN